MNHWKKVVFTVLAILGIGSVVIAAQDASTALSSQVRKQLKTQALLQMASQGYPLTVNSNVAESASVEAVLIPPRIADHIFGKETANNYLAIELIVSNHNPQASLIIESLFLDYTDWDVAQSGQANDCVNGKPNLTDVGPAQRVNCPKQMASAEYRLVRAELLDHQPFTRRNLIVNGATAIGSIGTAFAFPFSKDVVAGINGWNGGLIPALGAFYPDPTISQLNHISDLGFQTNKLIPKESSDIVVAFFPIQRLLTKSLAKIYQKDPAVFFVPGEIVVDPKYSKELGRLVHTKFPEYDVNRIGRASEECSDQENALRASAPEQPQTALASPDCKVSKFLNGIALTNIRIGIGGDMSVSTQLVPPTITAVDFGATYKASSPDSNAAFWNTVSTTPITGNILGTYLAGGAPSIVDSTGKAIANIEIKATGAGATDTNLPISLTIKECLPADTKEMYLKVTKQASTDTTTSAASSGAQSTSAVTSMPFGLGTYVQAGDCKKTK